MKIMASIGGWTYSQDGTIPRALDSPAKRERFAQTAADLVKNHGFDGIDLVRNLRDCFVYLYMD